MKRYGASLAYAPGWQPESITPPMASGRGSVTYCGLRRAGTEQPGVLDRRSKPNRQCSPASDMPHIAYVCPYIYPDHSAMSKRIEGLAKAFVLAGATVSVCAGDRARNQAEDTDQGATFGVSHVRELPARQTPKLSRAVRHLSYGNETVRWLSSQTRRVDAVVQYGGHTAYSRKLLKWCAANGSSLIIDVVEWYEASTLALGWGGPFHVMNELALRHYFPKAGNIVAISRYLENYYRERGCRTVRVPPIVECRRVTPRLQTRRAGLPLRVAYAGSPGKKDLLDPVIEALFHVNARDTRAVFVLAGVAPAEILLRTPFRRRALASLPEWLRATGRVTMERAMGEVRDADFSILFRPSRRYSEAGFPTKVVESLSLGTPLLCNVSGDLGEYLRDGKEALICSDTTVAEIVNRLEEAASLGRVALDGMRMSARTCAEKHFDVTTHAPRLREFLAGVCR